MMAVLERLAAAVAATRRGNSMKVQRDLAVRGWDSLDDYFAEVDEATRTMSLEVAQGLQLQGISVVNLSDERYPRRLRDVRQPPPFLFYWGNLRLVDTRGVGMCGSRDATPRGLEYARVFGRAVVQRGLQVISGYARGVDMETHLGALEAHGSTIIVLAEGIAHFRRKRAFASMKFDEANVLALSQFSPTQPWAAGAAMARNAVIAGLAQAMLVVEARERGGTLNAGLQAIQMGRPVYAIAYADDPPAGNQILFRSGAHPLRSQKELLMALDALAAGEVDEQLEIGT